MILKCLAFSAVLTLIVCGLPDPVSSQEIPSLKQTEAYRLASDEKFILDGRLDEPFWRQMTPITDFVQQEPVEGAAPSEKTEVYVAYDSENLYIGAKLYDSEPERIMAWQRRRNQSLRTDDRFMLILDTFNDGRNAYFFETNPAALRGDGLLTVGQGSNLNKAWDGIWDTRTSVTDEGWVVEMRIPFRSLDFNPRNSVWGINFQRTIRRNNEEILWSGWRRHQGLQRPQDAGTIGGLEGMDQGIGLEITPFVTGTGNRTWPDNDGETADDLAGDAGFDVTYSITPSLRTSLTVNTDFAETEVDRRRVNLTRFDLRFPEQRDFFLEGSSIFSFAPASSLDPFFSRRIGLAEGNQIPVNGGLRVLGREGNTNMGLYQLRTGRNDDRNPEDFTAARVSQNIGSESNIGVLYTRRHTLDDDIYNTRHTMGADMELGTSGFRGDKNLQFQAYFVWHNPHTPEEVSSFWDRTSRGIRINYPNFPFYIGASYREFGDSYDPAVGFTPRNAFRRFQPTMGYRQYFPQSDLIRSVDYQIRYEQLMDLDFGPADVNLTFSPTVEFESGDRWEVGIRRDFERLASPFDILRDGSMMITPGDYYNWVFDTQFNTAGYRRLSARVDFGYEGFWNGTRTRYSVSGTVRPYHGVNLTTGWTRNEAKLPAGEFSTDLLHFQGNIDLTPNTAFTNILQFDTVSDVLGLFNRFRWTITPGSDLYLVHTWNWIQVDDRFSPLETEGAIKFNFTYRF